MSSLYDVAVVGGGIAGLSAGLAGARLGRKTLVLTGEILGGQLLSIARVDGYPGFPEGVAGYDLCPMAQEQAVACGAELAAERVRSLRRADDGWHLFGEDGGEFVARAVVLATGARLRELGVPGEAALRGKGVSHCASCDGPLLRGRVVAVVGGGDSAAQEALTLAEFAARVILVHRGPGLSAQASYREAVRAHPRIETRAGCEVREILGQDSVTGVRLADAAGGMSDVDVFGVFAYTGLQPMVDLVKNMLQVGPSGGVPTDGWMRTDVAGLFAAGAVRQGWAGRAVASAGEGATAAIAADRYLRDLG